MGPIRRSWLRYKARREYKKRLESIVPRDPKSWDEVVDEMPVIEI